MAEPLTMKQNERGHWEKDFGPVQQHTPDDCSKCLRKRVKDLLWLVERKNRGLEWYAMPTHDGCEGADCPCMPGRALALTEADAPGGE